MRKRKVNLPVDPKKRREAAMKQEIKHSRKSLRYSLGAGNRQLRQARVDAEAHIRRKYGH